MPYGLRAVIAGDELLRQVSRDLPAARSAPLGQGLSLMPLMAGLLDSVADDSPEDGLALGLLPGGIGRLLADWSAAGPVAYVEAEYFGGVGEQHAAVWVTGPSCWVRSARPEGEPFAAAGSPISQALRRLGVVAAPSQDEFSTVGLGRHRYNERWVQADSSPRPSQSEESFTPGRAKK